MEKKHTNTKKQTNPNTHTEKTTKNTHTRTHSEQNTHTNILINYRHTNKQNKQEQTTVNLLFHKHISTDIFPSLLPFISLPSASPTEKTGQTNNNPHIHRYPIPPPPPLTPPLQSHRLYVLRTAAAVSSVLGKEVVRQAKLAASLECPASLSCSTACSTASGSSLSTKCATMGP